MPSCFDDVFIAGTGLHLPGPPVDNEGMDAYIAPLNRASGRIKQRILAEHGIRTRHYAIGPDGSTRESHAQMAATAVRAALADGRCTLADIGLLACGTSGGDAVMPGFANMVQGELAAPPMQAHTTVGVCAASLGALTFAAAQVQQGAVQRALAVGSDLPSRMFKRTRFAPRGYAADFNAHFLRWMLSDGAGALLLAHRSALPPDAPRDAPRLRLKWVHQRSFSGDHPACMQLGLNLEGTRSWHDYDSASAAEADGALSLRQNIRLLPNLFDVAIHEYAGLVQRGLLDPARVDHFLCHYSSERFRPIVDELMHKAGLAIPQDRWWTNLHSRGNTGAASLFVMLAEFVRTHSLREGEQIFCFVPESGRFTVAYALFEVERPGVRPAAPAAARAASTSAPRAASTSFPRATTALMEENEGAIAPPHEAAPGTEPRLAGLLQSLAEVWHDYRSQAWRTPLVRALVQRRFSTDDYLRWMAAWIPQVREGTRWMREAVASMREPYAALAALVDTHAGEEQNDFEILFADYRRAGGSVASIAALQRTPGGQALSAFLQAKAATASPVGLLGAIYVIEGTGQRIVPALLPLLRAQLPLLPPDAFRFLAYHGANDEHHLERWLRAVQIVLAADASAQAEADIVQTARRTAQLYLMQWQDAGPAMTSTTP